MNLSRTLLIPALLISCLSSCTMNPAGLWINNDENRKSFSLSLSPDNKFFISSASSNGGKPGEFGQWQVSNQILSCVTTNGKTYDWKIQDLSENRLILKAIDDGKDPLILRPVNGADYSGIWYSPNELNLGFSEGRVFVGSGTNARGQRIFNKGSWDYSRGRLTAQMQNEQKCVWYVAFFGADKMVLKNSGDADKPSAIGMEYKRLTASEWIGSWKQENSKITFRSDGRYITSGVNFGGQGSYHFTGRTLRLQQDNGKSIEYEILVYSPERVNLKNIGSPIESLWLRIKPE